jgi:hypothetical protein
MNKIILMLGAIIFTYFFFLSVLPNFEDLKGKKIYTKLSENSYNNWVHICSILFSIMINFLIWGWFI